MPKISVIVPMYNVEQYIERCATSLLEQTLDDIEYIFISDKSPDNSIGVLKKVLERFPSKAGFVRIVERPTNGGQAAVRRDGILLATGDFVIHCDADDWVDTNLYEKMYTEAIRTKADVVICPIRDEYADHGVTRPLINQYLTGKAIIEHWYHEPIGMFCWNKIVRRSILIDNNILPFEGINMWEDNGLITRVMYYADKISQIDDAVYHYNRANLTAMTRGYGRKQVDQMLKCAYLLDEFFKSHNDYDRFNKTALAFKFLAKLNLVTTSFGQLKECYTLYPESNIIISYLSKRAFSKKGNLRFWMVKHHMAWLFVLLFKIKSVVI